MPNPKYQPGDHVTATIPATETNRRSGRITGTVATCKPPEDYDHYVDTEAGELLPVYEDELERQRPTTLSGGKNA